MSKTPSLKTLQNRAARYGGDILRRSAQSWTTLEDGTVARWMLQWGSTQIGFSSLANVEAFLDRYEDVR